LFPFSDCGGAVIGISVIGKHGELEKEVKESKIIEKLKREKRDWKNVMKEQRLGKEEAIKKQKLEEKVAKMRMRAQSLKARLTIAGGKEGKKNQEKVSAILVSSSIGNRQRKVDGKLKEGGIKEKPIVKAKQEEVTERRSEDLGGSTLENTKELERSKQEEMKLEKTTDEGEKRVAFLLKLARKLRAQLQVPSDGNLKGTLEDEYSGTQLQDGGGGYSKTMLMEKLISAIKSSKQESQRMKDLEARHLEEHNIGMAQLQQKLLKEMTEKTQLELELAFVKSQAEKLQVEKSEVSNKTKESELKQLKKELASNIRRIAECEQELEESDRKCAIQREQQLKMRLENEEAESRWRKQMRAAQVKQLEENYVEVRNQVKSTRDAAENVLRQLTSIGDLTAMESAQSAVDQLNTALAALEADFEVKKSSVGDKQSTSSLQFPFPTLEPQLSPPLRLLLSLPQGPPASAPAPFTRQSNEETPLEAAPLVKKGKAGMLELLCSRIPSLTISAAEHYFAEVKHQHKGSLTGVPREEIVKAVEAILNQDLGRADGNQEAVECSICLENFKEVDSCTSLECGHIFHATCIKNWMEKCKEGSGSGSTCPNCRSSAL